MKIKEHAIRFRYRGKIIYLFIFFNDNNVSKKKPKRQFKEVRAAGRANELYFVFQNTRATASECVAQVSFIEIFV